MLPPYLVSTEGSAAIVRGFLFFSGFHISAPPRDCPHMASATPARNDGPPSRVDYLAGMTRESRSEELKIGCPSC